MIKFQRRCHLLIYIRKLLSYVANSDSLLYRRSQDDSHVPCWTLREAIGPTALEEASRHNSSVHLAQPPPWRHQQTPLPSRPTTKKHPQHSAPSRKKHVDFWSKCEHDRHTDDTGAGQCVFRHCFCVRVRITMPSFFELRLNTLDE